MTYVVVFLAFFGSYALVLHRVLSLAWPGAAAQALLLMALDLPLAPAMAKFSVLPRYLRRRVPFWLRLTLNVLSEVGQFGLPLLVWSAALLLLNRLAPGPALLASGALLLASGLIAVAWTAYYQGWPQPARLERIEVTLARLPEAFDGYRIVQVSDLHVGRTLGRAKLRRRLKALDGIEPDLLVATGDYATRQRRNVVLAAAELSRLSARAGRYAVLGNHDHRLGADFVRETLSAKGLRVLVNESALLTRGTGRLWLIGADDCSYQRFDNLDRALKGVPEAEAKILLSHSPDLWSEAQARGIDLVVSGHTHGGQIVLPWVGALVVPTRLGRKLAAGLFERKGARLYINRGLGEVYIPFRLGCPPEVTLLVLRAEAKEKEEDG